MDASAAPVSRRVPSGLLVLCTVVLATLLVALPWAPLQAGQEQVEALPPITGIFYASADAFVRQSTPTTNYGASSTLALGYSQIDVPIEDAIIIAFNLSGLPPGATVESATMYLYQTSSLGLDPVGTTLDFVTSAWTEGGVTWNSFPTIRPPGYQVLTWVNSTSGWKAWNVTSFVQDWQTTANNGVLLRVSPREAFSSRVFASREAGNAPYLQVTYRLPELSGRVYSGTVGDESQPLAGVTMRLYASNNLGQLGTLAETTTTDATGWYALSAPAAYEYYTIEQVDLPGYTSVGATTVSGTVLNNNQIRYSYPLTGKTLTGNKFWDQPVPTSTPTSTSTSTPTNTPTSTATSTPTSTSTSTPTATATSTPTSTPTSTVTSTPTSTPTSTTQAPTPTLTPQPPTPTATATSVPVPAAPDLTVTDVWPDGSQVCLQIQNIGGAAAPAGHVAALMVDGTVVAGLPVPISLAPLERWAGCFGYAWACTPPEDSLVGWADQTEVVAESDETNNRRERIVPCDTTAPNITRGPVATNVTHSSASISWDTDEPADSLVRFGRLARGYDGEQGDAVLATGHSIALTGLLPFTTYRFQVRSADAAGNSVTTRDATFQTLAEPDTEDPRVRIIDPGVIRGTTVIRAEATDNRGIARVEFRVNGRLVHTAYTPPYEWTLYADSWENGEYQLEARAFDFIGRSFIELKALTLLKFVDVTAPTARIYHPPTDYLVAGETRVRIYIEDDAGWSEVAWFSDGVQIGSGQFPTSPQLDLELWWDTRWLTNGPHTFAVTVTDPTGKVGSDNVRVNVQNTDPPPQPKLVVTKHELFRHGHVFALELTVQNKGQAGASGIQIRDSLAGFQPIAQSKDGYTIEGDLAVGNMVNAVLIKDSLSLAPGSTRTYIISLLPVLVHPNPPPLAVGSTISLNYSGAYGAVMADSASFALSATVAQPGQMPSEALATAHANAVKAADYLIVTNPGRLAAVNPGQDIDGVLSDMARLAWLRNGSLGYLRTTDRNVLRNLVLPAGDWAQRLHANFRTTAKGYLLLVGETEIIPSWNENRWNLGWSNSSCRTFEVHNSDLPYADTGGSNAAPELIVGRIIGNTVADLSRALRNSIENTTFDRSHALLVSGTDGNTTIQNSFVAFVNDAEKLINSEFSVTKIHFSTVAAAQREAEFRNNTSGRDLVVYQGHGGSDSWGPISTDEVAGNAFAWPLIPAVDFGTSNPVVLGWACLTGSYEDHAANSQVIPPNVQPSCFYDGGDDNIAEAFFDRGAAVYIGATEVSPINQNTEAGKAYMGKWWKSGITAGKALTDLKRDRWGSNGYWQLWVYEYNLYGDPRYGAAGGSILGMPTLDADAQPMAAPQAALEVTVPAYVVTPADGYDEVTIPGGGQILEAGQYRIPYYQVTLEYPVGHEVQAVTLVSRSARSLASGLHLPVHQNLTTRPEASAAAAAAPAPQALAEGWLPGESYGWEARKNADGTLTLIITLYPFQYNPLTAEAEYHQGFALDISYTTSAVGIVGVHTDRDVYPEGETVRVAVGLRNPGEAQDVRLSGAIVEYPLGAPVAGLPLATLAALSGDASYTLEWASGATAPGYYLVEVTLADTDGNILDRATAVFRLGIVSGRISALSATPGLFRVGDRIAISAEVENDGTLPLEGTLVVRVLDRAGQQVAEFTRPGLMVLQGNRQMLTESWDTSGQEGGSYTVTAYVQHDSTASEPVSVTVGTTARLFLPQVSNTD